MYFCMLFIILVIFVLIVVGFVFFDSMNMVLCMINGGFVGLRMMIVLLCLVLLSFLIVVCVVLVNLLIFVCVFGLVDWLEIDVMIFV